MTTAEQDKLWAQLSEETKEQMRERYNKPIEDSDPNAEYFRGLRYQTGLVFGKHNLKQIMTYEEVAKELFDKGCYQFADYGKEYETEFHKSPNHQYFLNFTSANQAKKFLAINKLLNVAKFLNKNEDGTDWVPDWENNFENKWYLGIRDGRIYIGYIFNDNSLTVYFRTKEIAQQAFQILGEDIVRTALTTIY